VRGRGRYLPGHIGQPWRFAGFLAGSEKKSKLLFLKILFVFCKTKTVRFVSFLFVYIRIIKL